MHNKHAEEAERIVSSWVKEGSGEIEFKAADRRLLEASIALSRHSAVQKEREEFAEAEKERRKSQIIVELYNDGKWWCVNGPGCDGFACAGHDTFKDWYMALKPGVKLVADFRSRQVEGMGKKSL